MFQLKVNIAAVLRVCCGLPASAVSYCEYRLSCAFPGSGEKKCQGRNLMPLHVVHKWIKSPAWNATGRLYALCPLPYSSFVCQTEEFLIGFLSVLFYCFCVASRVCASMVLHLPMNFIHWFNCLPTEHFNYLSYFTYLSSALLLLHPFMHNFLTN